MRSRPGILDDMANRALSALDDVRRMIDEPSLAALSYDVQVRFTTHRQHVDVTLRHPLRGNSDWGWMSLDLKPASLQQLATNVHEWPDIQVARSAQTVRHEVVPVLGALRHAEVMALLLYRHRRFRAGFNAAVAAITNVAVSLQETGGILNDEEVDWLQKAYESDLKELWAHPRPVSRSTAESARVSD